MRLMIVGIAAVAAAPLLAQQAPAKPAIEISSEVQAVKVVTDSNGKTRNVLVPATMVVPGTPLVYWFRYKNTSTKPVTGVVVRNPIANNIWFTDFGADSGWGELSVDGGKTYGPLASLKIKEKSGVVRAATRKDVTNVRWVLKTPVAPGASGVLSFYGIVQ